MERIINQIIEIELKAQEMVNEAKKKKDNLPNEINNALSAMREEHMKQAKSQVDKIKEQEAKYFSLTLEKIDDLQKSQMEKLEGASNEHFQEWAELIFKNVINLNM